MRSRLILKQIGVASLILPMAVLWNACGGGFQAIKPQDIALPSLGLVEFNDNSITMSVRDSVNLTGSCINGVPVVIGVAGQVTTVNVPCESSSFEYLMALPGVDGLKVISLYQRDLHSREYRDTVSVTKDTLPPILQILTVGRVASMMTIGGTCEEGLPVLVGADLSAGSAANCDRGTFSITATIQAGDGNKSLMVAQLDLAGNRGERIQSYVLDTTPPILTLTRPQSNQRFRDEVNLQGTCESNLAISASGTGLLNLVAGNCVSGNFDLNVTLSAGDGPKSINLIQEDADRNRGQFDFNLVRDNQGPNLSIASPTENSLHRLVAITVSGACEDGTSVNISGSGLVSAINASCTNSTYSGLVTLTSEDGLKNITASQLDMAGNRTTVNRNIELDTVSPLLVVSEPANNIFTRSALSVSGTCEPALNVTVSGNALAANEVVLCNAGTFQRNLNLLATNGVRQLSFVQTDGAGNMTRVDRSIQVDTSLPVVTIAQPLAAQVIDAASVTVSGTCEASEGNVTVAGTGIAAADQVPCSAGIYSANAVFTVGNGTKAIQVTQADRAGNIGTANVSVTKNQAMTQLAILMPQAGSLTQGSVSVSGQCQPSISIQFEGDVAAGTPDAACEANALFAANINLSSGDGLKTIIVRQLLVSGAVALDSRAVLKDSLAPVVNISSPASGARDQTGVRLIGGCESGLPVQISGSGIQQTMTTACNNSLFSQDILFSAGDGTKQIQVRQTDLANNQSISSTRDFIRDNVGPVLGLTSPAENASVLSAVNLLGTCEADIVISLAGSGFLSGNALCNNGVLSGNVTFTSGDGVKTVTLTQIDDAGNTSTLTRNVRKDTSPPVITISSPAADTHHRATVSLSGTCEPNLLIAVTGAGSVSSAVFCSSAGTFSNQIINFSAGEGLKSITLSQTDALNLTGSITRTFTKDTIVPAISISIANTQGFIGATANLIISCEVGLDVTVNGSGVETPFTQICPVGGIARSVAVTVGDGSKVFTARTTDLAGNGLSATAVATRDTTAPLITFTAPAANTIGDPGLTLSGTCQSGLTVSITGDVTSQTNTTCDGTFSAGILFSAGDGTKNIMISQTDLAGNVGSSTRAFLRQNPLLTGQQLYALHCAGCHQSLANSSKKNRSASQIQAAITANIGGMGSLANVLNSNQIDLIALALVEAQVAPSSDYRMPVANANHIFSAMADLMLPASTDASFQSMANTLVALTLGQRPVQGGPCTRYDTDCTNPNFIFAQMNPYSGPMRSGFIIRACEEVLQFDQAVNTVLSKVGLNVNSVADDTNVARVYDLFFVGAPVSSAVISDLRAIHQSAVAQGRGNLVAWRFIMVPLCTSEKFQSL